MKNKAIAIIISMLLVLSCSISTNATPEIETEIDTGKYELMATVKLVSNKRQNHILSNRSKRLLIANASKTKETQGVLRNLMTSNTLDAEIDDKIDSMLTKNFCDTPKGVAISALDNQNQMEKFYRLLETKPSKSCSRNKDGDTGTMLRRSLTEVSCVLGRTSSLRNSKRAIEAWNKTKLYFKRGFCTLNPAVPSEINFYRQTYGQNELVIDALASAPFGLCKKNLKNCIKEYSQTMETDIFSKFEYQKQINVITESINSKICFDWLDCKIKGRRGISPIEGFSRLIYIKHTSELLQTALNSNCNSLKTSTMELFPGYPNSTSLTSSEKVAADEHLTKMKNLANYLSCEFDQSMTGIAENQSLVELTGKLTKWLEDAKTKPTNRVIDPCMEAFAKNNKGIDNGKGGIHPCFR